MVEVKELFSFTRVPLLQGKKSFFPIVQLSFSNVFSLFPSSINTLFVSFFSFPFEQLSGAIQKKCVSA